jgi:DNA (cytosine-5)-methyltransferase 1
MMMEKLTVGSLFAGIGGFDLGLERSGGFEIAWQVEKDPYCQQVLAKHWPNIVRYGDIYECGKGRKYPLPTVDVLCGGFPCQPLSLAGKRQASEDERNLWPEFSRIIREIKPRWVLGENVLGLLSAEDGHFYGGVLRDLAEAGYDAEWCVLRASDVGAPHQRGRIFIVANTSGTGRQELNASSITGTSGHTSRRTRSPGAAGVLESRICRDAHGIPAWLDRYQWPAGPGQEQYDYEPSRIITEKQPNRVACLKALGNSIVPQCAEYIAHCILAYERNQS